MATANKLTYLNETKRLLRTNINALGNDITEEDTFRSYADALDEMWENQEQVTGTGESLTLNTKKGKMKVNLLGNTSQYTTTGKNLINVSNANFGSGSITLFSGSITAPATISFDASISSIPNVGGSTFVATIDGTNSYITPPLLKYSNGQALGQTPTVPINDRLSYTISSGTVTEIRLVNWSNIVGTYANVMLEQSNIPTTYEPYTGEQPSPSPDYPQQIHEVSGDNDIKVCGKNLAYMKDGTYTYSYNTGIITNNKFTLNTSGSSGAHSYFSFANGYTQQWAPEGASIQGINDMNITPNGGNYIFTINTSSSMSSNIGFYVWTSTNRGFSTRIDENTTKTLSISLNDNEHIKDYGIWTNNNNVFRNYELTLQLEKGSTATTYEPYTSTSYPIHLGDIELCKIGDYQDRFFKNIPNTTDYNSDLEDNEWYLEKKIRHLSLAIANMNNDENYPGWKNVPYIIEDLQGQGYIENLTSFKSNITDKRTSIAVTAYNSILYLDKNYGFGLTQTQWKTNYPNLVFELYYGLQTPTYTKITGTLKDELEAVWRANSYKGTTNINQINNDLPFIVDATALMGGGE